MTEKVIETYSSTFYNPRTGGYELRSIEETSLLIYEREVTKKGDAEWEKWGMIPNQSYRIEFVRSVYDLKTPQLAQALTKHTKFPFILRRVTGDARTLYYSFDPTHAITPEEGAAIQRFLTNKGKSRRLREGADIEIFQTETPRGLLELQGNAWAPLKDVEQLATFDVASNTTYQIPLRPIVNKVWVIKDNKTKVVDEASRLGPLLASAAGKEGKGKRRGEKKEKEGTKKQKREKKAEKKRRRIPSEEEEEEEEINPDDWFTLSVRQAGEREKEKKKRKAAKREKAKEPKKRRTTRFTSPGKAPVIVTPKATTEYEAPTAPFVYTFDPATGPQQVDDPTVFDTVHEGSYEGDGVVRFVDDAGTHYQVQFKSLGAENFYILSAPEYYALLSALNAYRKGKSRRPISATPTALPPLPTPTQPLQTPQLGPQVPQIQRVSATPTLPPQLAHVTTIPPSQPRPSQPRVASFSSLATQQPQQPTPPSRGLPPRPRWELFGKGPLPKELTTEQRHAVSEQSQLVAKATAAGPGKVLGGGGTGQSVLLQRFATPPLPGTTPTTTTTTVTPTTPTLPTKRPTSRSKAQGVPRTPIVPPPSKVPKTLIFPLGAVPLELYSTLLHETTQPRSRAGGEGVVVVEQLRSEEEEISPLEESVLRGSQVSYVSPELGVGGGEVVIEGVELPSSVASVTSPVTTIPTTTIYTGLTPPATSITSQQIDVLNLQRVSLPASVEEIRRRLSFGP